MVERLYTDLAEWWPLISPPPEYAEEAADLLPWLLEGAGPGQPLTLLELGAGGGSLAYHLKDRFRLTLTDRSDRMLANSRRVNPECEHVVGDMMTLDLGREFDRVLVHDAIMYATDPGQVRATLRTAARHCKSGGRIVVMPDCVRETFEPDTEHGGRDGEDGRAVRYLEWSWDPDPSGWIVETIYLFALREADGSFRVVEDRHRTGCFPRADWLRWFDDLGLSARIHFDPWKRDVFIAEKDAKLP